MKFKYEEMREFEFLKTASQPNIDADQPNVPLLRKHVEWVKEQARLDLDQRYEHDVFWNQGSWGVVSNVTRDEQNQVMTCQTGCCFAGNVAIHSDVTIIMCQEAPVYMMGVRTKDGELYTIETYAALQLGLNYANDDDIGLFAAENGVEEIEGMARVIAERAGETL